MPARRSETTIQGEALVALQLAYPDAVFDRRNVGMARDPRTGRVVRFGKAGQADVWGVVAGRHIEIELKASTNQTVAQRNWQRAVERAGGAYIVARSAEDAVRGVREYLAAI